MTRTRYWPRALQLWAPGIPQIYYVGLLAGTDDMDLLARSTVGRDVNRHHYTREETDSDLRRPVVSALTRLIRFRNSHPAFDGTFTVTGEGSALLASWINSDEIAELETDLANREATVRWTSGGTRHSAPVSALP